MKRARKNPGVGRETFYSISFPVHKDCDFYRILIRSKKSFLPEFIEGRKRGLTAMFSKKRTTPWPVMGAVIEFLPLTCSIKHA